MKEIKKLATEDTEDTELFFFVRSVAKKKEGNRAFFKRFMGFFKDQEKILAAAHHYHSSFIGHFNCINIRFGNCAFHLHAILKNA